MACRSLARTVTRWFSVDRPAIRQLSFTVTNGLGSVTGTFTIKALVPLWCKLTPIPSGLQLSFPTQTGQTYSVEEALHLPGDWNAWPGSFVGNGLTNYFNLPNAGGKFYRIRTE